MPKIVKTPLHITTISSRSDGSLRLSAVTPELSTIEKAEFLNLQNLELVALLQPTEYINLDEVKIKKDLDTKSPSERLRNILFVLFKAKEENGEDVGNFSDYYRNKMDKLIDHYKLKINEIRGY